jgi:hypothetical protein
MITDRAAPPAARDNEHRIRVGPVRRRDGDRRSYNTSFDSSEFPKPVFLDALDPDDRRAACHGSR